MWMYIIGGIVLFFALLLLSPIVVWVKFEETLHIKLRFWFVSYTLYPKKPKTKTSPKKQTKKEQPSSVQPQGTLEKVKSIFGVLGTLLSASVRLISGARVRNLNLTLGITGKDAADAAITYGQVCSVVYPVLGFADSKMKLINPKVNIYCDYNAEKSITQGSGKVCITVYHAVGTAFYILKELIKKNLRK